MSAMNKGALLPPCLPGSPHSEFRVPPQTTLPETFKPLHGISLHVGSKHAVGYFVPTNGVCELTLVVG